MPFLVQSGMACSSGNSGMASLPIELAERHHELFFEIGNVAVLLFRAMKSDGTKPIVGETRRELGAKPGAPPDGDIPVDAFGRVEAGTGGMSVAPCEVKHLPRHRRPPAFGGEGRDPVFFLSASLLPESLAVRMDRPTHAMVEPTSRCTFIEYQEALHATRPTWELYHV